MLVMFLRYNWKEKGHILECNKDLHGFWEERVVGPMLPIMCDYECIIIISSKVKTKEEATFLCLLSKGQW